MDMEQFKLLLEVATAAGEGASWLLVIWMLKGLAQTCLLVGLGGSIVLVVYKLLKRRLDDESLVTRFSREFDMHGSWSEYEKNLVIEWAAEGRAARLAKSKQ